MVTTSSWQHHWMGWESSKQRHVTFRKKLVVVGLGRESEARFLKRTIRWVEHKRWKSLLRSLVLGYLATDRPDVRAVPCTHLAWSFTAGANLEYLNVYAESDWAAKETERKSCSCVVIKLDRLCSKRVQRRKACLSSDAGDLYAATRAAACGIQPQQFLTEIGCPFPLCVHGDSASARGMMTRRGSGRVKHHDPGVKQSKREQSSRHRHQDAECRQNRSSPTTAGKGHSMSIAGYQWSRTKTTRRRDRRDQGVIPKSKSQRHGRMGAKDLRKKAK